MLLRKSTAELLFLGAAIMAMIAVFGATGLFRTLIAGLLAFVLPGRALLAAWYPQRLADAPANLLLTLALSTAVTALGGLLLNLTTPGLSVLTWALWLGGVTLVNTVIALLRALRSGEAMRLHLVFRPAQWLLLVVAALLVFAALALARTGAVEQPRPGFTQLWLIQTDPQTLIQPGTGSARLGLRNEEGKAMQYRLILRHGATIVQVYEDIQLEPDQVWEITFPLTLLSPQPQAPYEALLYRLDDLETVYRSVTLSPQTTG